MNKANNDKELFLSLYNQLNYDYQSIILNAFKCLVTYEDIPEKGYQAYAVADLIKYYQNKKGYTDAEVCDKVTELASTTKEYISLEVNTYQKIKQRNTQSSKHRTNWLSLIAEVLEFDYEEYHKYLTDEGLLRSQELITKRSNDINSIDTLYDLLSTKEKTAIHQLTISLLNLCATMHNE